MRDQHYSAHKIACQSILCMFRRRLIRQLAGFGAVLLLALVSPIGSMARAETIWFDPFLLQYTLSDGQVSPDGHWYLYWAGYGTVGTKPVNGDLAMQLQPARATQADETHSALLTTMAVFTDHLLDLDVRTVKQLRVERRGRRWVSTPNPWEVAWVLWRVVNPDNFYYFMVKPNGAELGKVQDGVQYFLATTDSPKLTIGAWDRWTIQAQQNRFSIWVNGEWVMDYTDPDMTLTAQPGAVGLYSEDASVQFDNVRVTAP